MLIEVAGDKARGDGGVMTIEKGEEVHVVSTTGGNDLQEEDAIEEEAESAT